MSKADVREFWDSASCGEALLLSTTDKQGYFQHYTNRYALEEGAIAPFFLDVRGKKVLEVGVGLGADHHRLSILGAELTGIDLTPRAIEHAKRVAALFDIKTDLSVGDVENLAFPENSFDIVFAWGVIHHTPDTKKAAAELVRVLKPGGEFRVMIYHKYSIVGLMLWLRYGAIKRLTLNEVYARYLESPGTKAYTISEAKKLFAGCENIKADVVLSHADLLSSGAGQRHNGALIKIARMFWPRWLIRRVFPNSGLFLRVTGRKPA
jgi:ubiquinone/menaquinone biosynthesis C-methylase UbiE